MRHHRKRAGSATYDEYLRNRPNRESGYRLHGLVEVLSFPRISGIYRVLTFFIFMLLLSFENYIFI